MSFGDGNLHLRVEALQEENEILMQVLMRVWPIVTRHTSVTFWGPLEEKIRNRRKRLK